jgi:hypothetical protein
MDRGVIAFQSCVRAVVKEQRDRSLMVAAYQMSRLAALWFLQGSSQGGHDSIVANVPLAQHRAAKGDTSGTEGHSDGDRRSDAG